MTGPWKKNDIIRRIREETNATGLIGDDSVTDAGAATAVATGSPTAGAVASRAGAALAVTWSSNDPAGTPNSAITIADGNLMTAAETTEFLEEVEGGLAALAADDTLIVAEVDKLVTDMAEGFTAIDANIADILDIKTQLNLALTALEAAGILSA